MGETLERGSPSTMAALAIPLAAEGIALLGGAILGGLLLKLAIDDYTNRESGAGPKNGEHNPNKPRYYGSKDRHRNGDFIQEDQANRSGGGAHGGGKQYKHFDRHGKRLGTYSEDGDLIRD